MVLEYGQADGRVDAYEMPARMEDAVVEKTLYNAQSNNCCAYCRHHQAYMTVKQMKCKNCLGKQCRHFVKNEAHQYWRQRELIKQKRKDRKQMIDSYIAAVQGGM